MSQECYLVCDQCKKKVHIGCIGLSGVQCWTGEPKVMKAFFNLMTKCALHLDKLKFVWEQTTEDEHYEEEKTNDQ